MISVSLVCTWRPTKRRLDGQFAMPAVDQHAQPDALRTAQIEQPVHRRANRASGVQHVVDQDQILVVHRKRNVARLQHGLRRNLGKVVAIQRDVQRPHRHIHAVDAAHGLRDALGQRNAAPADSDQCQIRRAAALFHDFVRQPLHACGRFRSPSSVGFSRRCASGEHPSTEAAGPEAAVIGPTVIALVFPQPFHARPVHMLDMPP